MFKRIKCLFLCIAFLPLLSCNADEKSQKYQAGEGKDYEVLAIPVHTNDPSKIEVVEAFWYGCSHCFHFEPVLEPWISKLPKDVVFVGLPVMWDDELRILHAKMYYTALSLKKLDTLHSAIFTAMNVNRKSFSDEGEIAKFFNDNGVDSKDFAKTFNSFGVDSLVKQAGSKVRGYNVTGTPTLIINGKYKIMGTPEKMLAVADFLIEKERTAMKAAKK